MCQRPVPRPYILAMGARKLLITERRAPLSVSLAVTVDPFTAVKENRRRSL